jgi:transcriptional regulator with XRE-family HTH domain
MVLLRRVIGDALRARRQAQHRTLREVSTAANVSLGYLSEIERGQKEASSELLAAICAALGAHLSELLREVSHTVADAEQGKAAPARASITTRVDGDLAVTVRQDTPLRATLRATRKPRADEREGVLTAA